jgi:hypothetical protein
MHVAAGGFEGWQVWIKGGNIHERISNNIVMNAKFVQEFANNRMDFCVMGLYFFFINKNTSEN